MRPPSDDAGIGLKAFDLAFDDHFNVRSAWIKDALDGKTPVKATTKDKYADRCKSFPEYRERPEAWGINVSFLGRLFCFVEADLDGYSSAHCFSSDFAHHVCLVDPCPLCHEDARTMRRSQAKAILPMKANMHLVVQRYVKPWTRDFGVGFALMMNAGHIARKSSVVPKDFCLAKVFISHCWNEGFRDFVSTLRNSLDPQTVVWVCSFAIWQHGDIAGALSSLEECPFAIALGQAERVIAVTDSTTEAFKRCWVVLEAEIARKWSKPYNISLPEDGNLDLWQTVGEQLGRLDVNTCDASREEDKLKIMDYARLGKGGIEGLNEQVRCIALGAMKQAKIMAITMSGDIGALQDTDASHLGTWKNIRGMTATHIAAMHARVGAVMEILTRTEYTHTNLGDNDLRTPLSVAAENGSLAAVQALLNAQATPNIASRDGLTPLHYAALKDSPTIVDALLDARADVEGECKFQGSKGSTAVIIAARLGNAGVITTLARRGANLETRCATGRTPLSQAASWGSVDTMAALLAARAEVDRMAEEEVERTPLMIAVLHARYTAVCTLLGAGADINATSSVGKTASEYCDEVGKANPETAQAMASVLGKFQDLHDMAGMLNNQEKSAGRLHFRLVLLLAGTTVVAISAIAAFVVAMASDAGCG